MVNDALVRQGMNGKTDAARRARSRAFGCTWLRTPLPMPVTIVKTTGENRFKRGD